MSRAIAAALVLAATALLAPASAIGQAAPNPDPLWSEFPLTPLVATVPTSSTPAPALEQPVREDPTVRRGDSDRTAGFLILVGAAVAAGAGFVGRRRVGKRRDSGGEIQPEPERAAVHTFERPTPPVASASATSVAVASRPRGRTATPGATLIETLSPQARLADQLEEGESWSRAGDAPDVRDRVLARLRHVAVLRRVGVAARRVARFTVLPGARQGSAGAERCRSAGPRHARRSAGRGRLGAGGLRRGVVLGALPAPR